MTIRWGIIGCGDVARKRVARAIQMESRSELVSVCRRDETKLRNFCDEFGVANGSTSADELIAAPDIDALYIATPVNLHQPQTIAAAQAEKHVLVEKPMAMSTAECDAMIEACRSAGVRLGVAYYRPFYPVVQRILELVESGSIGTVMSVSAITANPFTIAPEEDGYWRVLPEQGGGGALMDIGSHRLDLFLGMFGPIAEVQGFCGTVAADYQADDIATVALRFESGIHGTVQVYFGADPDPDELTIVGTRGRLIVRPLNDGELTIEQGDGTTIEQHPPHENFNAPLIADFVTAILENREPLISGSRGREVNRLMEHVYQNS